MILTLAPTTQDLHVLNGCCYDICRSTCTIGVNGLRATCGELKAEVLRLGKIACGVCSKVEVAIAEKVWKRQ